ncbi:Odorant receptor, partial [Operophtera brumata]
MLQRLNLTLKAVSDWGDANLVKFNASKTQACLFSAKKNTVPCLYVFKSSKQRAWIASPEMETKEFLTFDTLRPHFDALARVAYFKIVLKTLSPTKRRLHYAYRLFTWTISSNTDEVVDTLFILLTTLNTLGKQIAFNARIARIEDIIQLINSPDFAVTKPYHVMVMKSNGQVMSVLLKLYHSAIFVCGTLWTIFPIVNRVFGEEDVFGLAHAYMSILITFQGYGNVTMDCTIVALFSQARTQVQILRYNLEQLANQNDTDSKINAKRHNTRGILSAEFVSMAVYLGCMLGQLFIYCYFGTQLKVESEFLNQSLYSTDWLSLSPRFRRQILLMMQYCYHPISPRTAYIVPMSLDTYIK